MYPIYSMDIALPVMKSRWEDASGKVPEQCAAIRRTNKNKMAKIKNLQKYI